MSIQLAVMVELPDGTVDYRPIAVYKDGVRGTEIKKFGTRKQAYDWAEFILPEKIRIMGEV